MMATRIATADKPPVETHPPQNRTLAILQHMKMNTPDFYSELFVKEPHELVDEVEEIIEEDDDFVFRRRFWNIAIQLFFHTDEEEKLETDPESCAEILANPTLLKFIATDIIEEAFFKDFLREFGLVDKQGLFTRDLVGNFTRMHFCETRIVNAPMFDFMLRKRNANVLLTSARNHRSGIEFEGVWTQEKIANFCVDCFLAIIRGDLHPTTCTILLSGVKVKNPIPISEEPTKERAIHRLEEITAESIEGGVPIEAIWNDMEGKVMLVEIDGENWKKSIVNEREFETRDENAKFRQPGFYSSPLSLAWMCDLFVNDLVAIYVMTFGGITRMYVCIGRLMFRMKKVSDINRIFKLLTKTESVVSEDRLVGGEKMTDPGYNSILKGIFDGLAEEERLIG